MTDIVDQLRQVNAVDRNIFPSPETEINRLARQAADEIERLRDTIDRARKVAEVSLDHPDPLFIILDGVDQ